MTDEERDAQHKQVRLIADAAIIIAIVTAIVNVFNATIDDHPHRPFLNEIER